MNGKRPISCNEYNRIHAYLTRYNRLRDRAMISLCYHTGYRIKEILSVKVKDVFTPAGEVRGALYVAPKKMKKDTPRMAISIREDLSNDLQAWRSELIAEDMYGPDLYLLQSQKGANKAISYTQAYRIIMDLFDACQVYDNVAVHSFRKAFCERVFHGTNKDIVRTQRIMGHTTPVTTLKYLHVDVNELQDVIMNM